MHEGKQHQHKALKYKDTKVSYDTGTKVLVFTPTIEKIKEGSKLSIYWTGPCNNVETISKVVFIVKTLGNRNKKELAMTVGIDRIKPFEVDSIPSPQLNLDANSILPYDMFAEHQQKKKKESTCQ